jgi:small subunit ribosomal protein S16
MRHPGGTRSVRALPWEIALIELRRGFGGFELRIRTERRTFMSARIRLKKFGTKKRPYYRIVVMDTRSPRDGKAIEELGLYHPIEVEDKQISFNPEKVKFWLQNGAAPSDTVRKLLNKKNFSL